MLRPLPNTIFLYFSHPAISTTNSFIQRQYGANFTLNFFNKTTRRLHLLVCFAKTLVTKGLTSPDDETGLKFLNSPQFICPV